jgi:homopolymeric O-antigen transport system permease protein
MAAVPEIAARGAHTTVIEPEHRFARPNLGELWDARYLVWLLLRRDVSVRYRQTAIGALWAVVQPVTLAAVYSVTLGVLANVPSQADIPYPVYALSGMVMWLYVQQAINRSSDSTVSAAHIISKVYFPRVALPVVAVVGPVVDLAVGFVVLLVVMTAYGHPPGIEILAAPAVVLLAMATALSLGLWFSAVAVRYRDVQHVVPFLMQIGLFITPIVYPFDLVPDRLQPLYALNPLVGIMEVWRWTLFGEMTASWELVLIPVAVSLVLIVAGSVFFRRAERTFADYA